MQNITFHLLYRENEGAALSKCMNRARLRTKNIRHSRVCDSKFFFACESVLILFQQMPRAWVRLLFFDLDSRMSALTFLQPNGHCVQRERAQQIAAHPLLHLHNRP